jgi:hypothetical protein
MDSEYYHIITVFMRYSTVLIRSLAALCLCSAFPVMYYHNEDANGDSIWDWHVFEMPTGPSSPGPGHMIVDPGKDWDQ